MPPVEHDPPMPPGHTGPATDDFAKRIAKARHDLRNPLAHILGFTELRIESATERGYNFLKTRLQLVERTANDLVAQVNGCLDAQRIQDGLCDIAGLQQQLREHSRRIITVAETLGRRRLVRQDAEFSTDLVRIAEAARRLAELSGPALEFLLKPAKAESETGN